MKALAINLIKGNEIKTGNQVSTIISVNENYSSEKIICFNVLAKAATIKRRGGIYKNNSYSEIETTVYLRKTTLVEIRN